MTMTNRIFVSAPEAALSSVDAPEVQQAVEAFKDHVYYDSGCADFVFNKLKWFTELHLLPEGRKRGSFRRQEISQSAATRVPQRCNLPFQVARLLPWSSRKRYTTHRRPSI